MAKRVRITGLKELEDYMDNHAKKTTPLMKRCVYTAAYAVADAVRKSGTAAISKDPEHTKRQTGELFSDGHFGVAGIKGSLGEANTSVGFDGYDSKGSAIPAIAASLESGNMRGQQATHFFSRAVREAKPQAFTGMQKIVNKFMENDQGE